MEEINRALKELELKLEAAKESEKQQQEFEKKSAIRFNKNLDAFEKFFPKLHREIKNFKPRESFNVFATKSGAGNFVPADSEVPIYGQDPLKQSKHQVEKAVEKPVFGMVPPFLSVDKSPAQDDRLHIHYMRTLGEALNSQDIYNHKKMNSLTDHFPTCIMFGLGLGYALSELLNNHTFDYTFICEPDFETFYASLFCIDWDDLLNNVDKNSGSVFLHIGVSYTTFFDEIQQVCNRIGAFSLSSSFCFQHMPTPKINLLIKEFYAKFYQIHLGYGFYNDAVTGMAHTLENFNKNRCPVFTPPHKNKKTLNASTAYVVANGPSLDEAVEVLKSNQKDVVIFAAGTALPTLLKLNIKPDFHVLVERPKNTYDVLVKTVSKKDLSQINLLAVDVIYPEAPPLYKWAGLGLKGPEAGTVISQFQYLKQTNKFLPSLSFGGPLVANTAIAFAAMMGFEEIYMIGVDNGYPTGGNSHSSYSIYNDKKFEGEFIVNKNAPHKLDGNLEGSVHASSLMVQAKQQIELVIKNYKNTTFYNVGNGAKIEGAIPLEVDDVICAPGTRDKNFIIEKIKTEFFDTLFIEKPEELAAIPELKSICDYLIDISERQFLSRKEASDMLKAQSRLIFAYKGSINSHLFHVIKGTMLYFHCPLISLLYSYEDESKTLEAFKAGLAVWIRCIQAIKQDYPNAWNKRCELTLQHT